MTWVWLSCYDCYKIATPLLWNCYYSSTVRLHWRERRSRETQPWKREMGDTNIAQIYPRYIQDIQDIQDEYARAGPGRRPLGILCLSWISWIYLDIFLVYMLDLFGTFLVYMLVYSWYIFWYNRFNVCVAPWACFGKPFQRTPRPPLHPCNLPFNFH